MKYRILIRRLFLISFTWFTTSVVFAEEKVNIPNNRREVFDKTYSVRMYDPEGKNFGLQKVHVRVGVDDNTSEIRIAFLTDSYDEQKENKFGREYVEVLSPYSILFIVHPNEVKISTPTHLSYIVSLPSLNAKRYTGRWQEILAKDIEVAETKKLTYSAAEEIRSKYWAKDTFFWDMLEKFTPWQYEIYKKQKNEMFAELSKDFSITSIPLSTKGIWGCETGRIVKIPFNIKEAPVTRQKLPIQLLGTVALHTNHTNMDIRGTADICGEFEVATKLGQSNHMIKTTKKGFDQEYLAGIYGYDTLAIFSVDIKEFRNYEVIKKLKDLVDTQDFSREILNEITNKSGLNVFEDVDLIQGVIAFKKDSSNPNMLFVLSGRFNEDKIIEYLNKEWKMGIEKSGEKNIYRWNMSPYDFGLYFLNNEMLVVGDYYSVEQILRMEIKSSRFTDEINTIGENGFLWCIVKIPDWIKYELRKEIERASPNTEQRREEQAFQSLQEITYGMKSLSTWVEIDKDLIVHAAYETNENADIPNKVKRINMVKGFALGDIDTAIEAEVKGPVPDALKILKSALDVLEIRRRSDSIVIRTFLATDPMLQYLEKYCSDFTRISRTSEVSHRNRCITNLKQIEGAVERYAMENQLRIDETVTMNNLVEGGYLKFVPSCPDSGPYASEQTVGTTPTCPGNLPGHVLP